MANAVVIIAPNKEEQLKYCLPSVWHFSEKWGVDIEVVRSELFYFHKGKYNYKIFEKFQVQRFTEKYDRILRLDSDIVFSPDCPNLFDLFSEDKVWGVFEDTGSRRKDRREQMKLIQNIMGDLNWTEGYMNSGVVLTSRTHKELYNVDKDYLRWVISKGLGKFKEQNLLNWRIRNLGYEVGDMGYKFNHMSMNSGKILDSYIIHVAGRQSTKELKMKLIYNQWYGHKT